MVADPPVGGRALWRAPLRPEEVGDVQQVAEQGAEHAPGGIEHERGPAAPVLPVVDLAVA